jgi:hypothetical protein
MEQVKLPRYIVEKNGTNYAIWDTVEHEYTGFQYSSSEYVNPKEEASKKCKEFNSKTV